MNPNRSRKIPLEVAAFPAYFGPLVRALRDGLSGEERRTLVDPPATDTQIRATLTELADRRAPGERPDGTLRHAAPENAFVVDAIGCLAAMDLHDILTVNQTLRRGKPADLEPSDDDRRFLDAVLSVADDPLSVMRCLLEATPMRFGEVPDPLARRLAWRVGDLAFHVVFQPGGSEQRPRVESAVVAGVFRAWARGAYVDDHGAHGDRDVLRLGRALVDAVADHPPLRQAELRDRLAAHMEQLGSIADDGRWRAIELPPFVGPDELTGSIIGVTPDMTPWQAIVVGGCGNAPVSRTTALIDGCEQPVVGAGHFEVSRSGHVRRASTRVAAS